ncbi:hypothetical protein ACWPKS_07255 [Coraliomargarita sp. W4R72]
MKTNKTSNIGRKLVFCCCLLGLTGIVSASQKGLGDAMGIAKSQELPQVVSLAGQLIQFNTHPCELTTGSAPLGTHLLLKMEDGREINLHLGPSTTIKHLLAEVKEGSTLQVQAFHTDPMKPNDYVAVSLNDGKKTVVLRDAKTLRPVWAGKKAKQARHGNGKGNRTFVN